jgi:hypothetical protein
MPRPKAEVDGYISALHECGWFENVPQSTVERIKRQIRETSGSESLWMSAFPVCIDTECIYEEGAYTKLIKEFSKASGGVFAPAGIAEKWTKTTAKLEFTHAGRQYSASLSVKSDYVDMKCISLMKKAIKESKAAVNYVEVPIPHGGQEAFYALTTPAAIKKAKAKRLIPSEEAAREERERREEERKKVFSTIHGFDVNGGFDRLAVGSYDKLWLYRWPTKELLHRRETRNGIKSCVLTRPDGRVCFSDGNQISIWNPETDAVDEIVPYDSDVSRTRCVVTPGGELLMCDAWSYDPKAATQVQCWSIEPCKKLNQWPAPGKSIATMTLTSDGKLLIGTYDGVVSLFTLDGTTLSGFNLVVPAGAPVSVSLHPGENVVACVAGQSIGYWDVKTGALLCKCDYKFTAQNAQKQVCFAPSGAYILTWGGRDGRVSQYEYPSGRLLLTKQMYDDDAEITALLMKPQSDISASAGTLALAPAIVFFDWKTRTTLGSMKGMG